MGPSRLASRGPVSNTLYGHTRDFTMHDEVMVCGLDRCWTEMGESDGHVSGWASEQA